MIPGYPFSAIVGHDRLRLALLLCAVRPEIGGVLIRGEKGTAKSTAVRALAHVLTSVDGASLVELPIGATEDRVVGSLDLQKVLRDGEHAFSPGLLARAHGGVLYVDEVNLLHDIWSTSSWTPPRWAACTSNATAFRTVTRRDSC